MRVAYAYALSVRASRLLVAAASSSVSVIPGDVSFVCVIQETSDTRYYA